MTRSPASLAITIRSCQGTASLELAIIAPMLLMMVMGISDLAMTSLAKLKSMNATASASDLATQSANLQTSDMVDIFAGAMNVMAPLGSSTLALRISSIASTGKGNAFVHWSCGLNGLAPLPAGIAFTTMANGSPVTNGLNLSNYISGGFTYNGTDTTFVQAEATYTYTAPTQFLLKGQQIMTASYMNYPRQAAYVGFPWDGTSTNPPATPSAAIRAGSITLSNGAVCTYMF